MEHLTSTTTKDAYSTLPAVSYCNGLWRGKRKQEHPTISHLMLQGHSLAANPGACLHSSAVTSMQHGDTQLHLT